MSELTYQDVLRILSLIEASKRTNFELESEGIRIKVERKAPGQASPVQRSTTSSEPPDPKQTAQIVPDKLQETEDAEALAEFPDATAVIAPMIGIFYAAPTPKEPPFVEVGNKVKQGDQLGIIEVMKLFTPITAPCDGVVLSILVENQQTVAKDAVLMLIDAK